MEILKNDFDAPDTGSKKRTSSISAKVLIALTGGVGVGLTIVCASFVAPALRKYCLPYVPATPAQIKNVLSLLPTSRNFKDKLLDIGSGDGRIVIASSKHGLESHGIELNSWLVFYSRFSAFKHNVWNNTKFFRGDLWKFNISPYNYVVIFGVEQMMDALESKLVKEAKPGCKVIACRFPLPGLIPEKTRGLGVDTVWLYTLSQKNEENISDTN